MTVQPDAPDAYRLEGRTWVFGEDVNTDDMYPGFAMKLPVPEAARHMFDASRRGWPELVQHGDIVIGGRGFGIGSSRAVPLLFRELGVQCVISERFNSLFFRNCVNYGLPALEVPGITELVSEGDIVRVDWQASEVVNVARDDSLPFLPLPTLLMDILSAGGVVAKLEGQGYLQLAETFHVSASGGA